MKLLVPLALVLVALLHAPPLLGVLGAERLSTLYGIAAPNPATLLLLRHRAVLFGLLAAGLAWAAWHPALHGLGLGVGVVSVASFLALAALSPPLTPALALVVKLDLAALVLLLAAAVVHWLPGSAP